MVVHCSRELWIKSIVNSAESIDAIRTSAQGRAFIKCLAESTDETDLSFECRIRCGDGSWGCRCSDVWNSECCFGDVGNSLVYQRHKKFWKVGSCEGACL